MLSRQLGTQKKTRSTHDDVIDLQVIALERGPEFPTYNSELDDRSKLIFLFGASFFLISQLS